MLLSLVTRDGRINLHDLELADGDYGIRAAR
jgi:hypothetical protein